MKEYIVRRYLEMEMKYLVLPEDQITEKERRDAIELPINVPKGIKASLLEKLNDESISKTVFQEKEEIRVSEGYGQREIADYKIIFGNVSRKLTYPDNGPDLNAWHYKHYTLTPNDKKGAIVEKTSSRIAGSYVNTKVFIIPTTARE